MEEVMRERRRSVGQKTPQVAPKRSGGIIYSLLDLIIQIPRSQDRTYGQILGSLTQLQRDQGVNPSNFSSSTAFALIAWLGSAFALTAWLSWAVLNLLPILVVHNAQELNYIEFRDILLKDCKIYMYSRCWPTVMQLIELPMCFGIEKQTLLDISDLAHFIHFSAGWPSWLLISFLYSPVFMDLISVPIVLKTVKDNRVVDLLLSLAYVDASLIFSCLAMRRKNKQKSRFNPSELPGELVQKIANLITSLEDFVALSGVCRLWRYFCLTSKWRPGRHQFPWLILSDKERSQNQSFFSFHRNNRYEVKLPQVSGRRRHGSPHGWIVTISPDLDASLLHPLSRVEVSLPTLNTIWNDQIGNDLVAADPFGFIHKCILFKISEDDDQFLVMVIFGPSYCLAFAKPGFVEWKTVGGLDGVKDVAVYRGQIHAICGQGRLLRFESEESVRLIASQPEDMIDIARLYLVESSGELWGIFRFSSTTLFDQRTDTKCFFVYKLQLDINGTAGTWERLSHLGDWAVFLGEGNSWSICTTDILNCRGNRIYFTDDNWDQPGRGGHDIGVFDMVSNQIELLEFGSDPPYHSRSVWFTPSLPPCETLKIALNMHFQNCGTLEDGVRRWRMRVRGAMGTFSFELSCLTIFVCLVYLEEIIYPNPIYNIFGVLINL